MWNVWNNPDTGIKHCLSLSGATFVKHRPVFQNRRGFMCLDVIFIFSCELQQRFDLIGFIADIIIIKQQYLGRYTSKAAGQNAN